MTSVLTSVPSDDARDTTLIPFSLWTIHGLEASVLAKAELPHLRTWLTQAQRVAVHVDTVEEPLLATLSRRMSVHGRKPWVGQRRMAVCHGLRVRRQSRV